MFLREQLKHAVPLIDGLLYELPTHPGHFDSPESIKYF